MVILFSGKKKPPSALTADGASPKDGMMMSPCAQIIFADMYVTYPAATARVATWCRLRAVTPQIRVLIALSGTSDVKPLQALAAPLPTCTLEPAARARMASSKHLRDSASVSLPSERCVARTATPRRILFRYIAILLYIAPLRSLRCNLRSRRIGGYPALSMTDYGAGRARRVCAAQPAAS